MESLNQPFIQTDPKSYCSVCLDEKSDHDNSVYKMITQCNHYFHKKCYYRANRDKVQHNCPYCRAVNPSCLTSEIYSFFQIPKSHFNNINLINIICLKIGITNYAISGSFALHLHQTLHNQPPKWDYNDIDVYYSGFDSKRILNIMLSGEYIIFKKNIFQHNDNYPKISPEIKDITKLTVYTKISNENEDFILKKIFSIDLISVHQSNPYNIINYFDLDCCKISFIYGYSALNFYINNDFYVDSYKIPHISRKYATLNRVKKYRARGFLCENIENYDEE